MTNLRLAIVGAGPAGIYAADILLREHPQAHVDVLERLLDPRLRRERRDVVAEHRRHAPGLRDVPVEAVRLVLGEHDDLSQIGIDEVRQGEIDDAEFAAKVDGGLGALPKTLL